MSRSIALALALVAVPALAGDGFAFWPGADYDPAVPTFEAVLGHAPGERITPPDGVVRYFEALAAAAPDRVRLTEYATSWDSRRFYLRWTVEQLAQRPLALSSEQLSRLRRMVASVCRARS